MKIGILILAAGASSRLGEAKQLLKFEGKTLLRRAAETALAANQYLVAVVLGFNADVLKTEIEDLPLEIVAATDWQDGMSRSISAGLRRLTETAPDLSAAVVMLCDQPLITLQTIEKLIEEYQKTGKAIVAAEYNETIGVPALFAREKFDELLALKGDAGARSLIKKQAASELAKIAVPEAAFDVDTPTDYKNLRDLN